jgi:NTP pyrophosphatase (non-canonical NTP hydrolase)
MNEDKQGEKILIVDGEGAMHAVVRAIECGEARVIGAETRSPSIAETVAHALAEKIDSEICAAIPPTDAEILATLQGDKCAACGGRKKENHAFCATDFVALTIFQRRQMSMALKGERFYEKYRSALRHLQLNPTRVKQLPSRDGEWAYKSDEELEAAGYKFLEHARCNVPRCDVRIVWYRTPTQGKLPVNLATTSHTGPAARTPSTSSASAKSAPRKRLHEEAPRKNNGGEHDAADQKSNVVVLDQGTITCFLCGKNISAANDSSACTHPDAVAHPTSGRKMHCVKTFDSGGLTFQAFQDANTLRSKEAFAGSHEWGVSEIAVAIAGEAGELCNIVKKINRGDFTLEEKRLEVLKEAADTITYCDKLITKLGARTDEVLRQKFNEVNERVGWKGNL